jgi:uncharacterized protein with GYD domain
MPLVLLQATYAPEGAKGLIKDGGSKRKAAIKQMFEAAGGKLHAMYFGFGEHTVVIIAETPDNATAAAVGLVVNASGVLSHSQTTVLITPEEMDAAAKKSITYRAPGS